MKVVYYGHFEQHRNKKIMQLSGTIKVITLKKWRATREREQKGLQWPEYGIVLFNLCTLVHPSQQEQCMYALTALFEKSQNHNSLSLCRGL